MLRALKRLLCALTASVLLASTAAAQQPPPGPAPQKPVMENVFFNVVWGSATGALLGVAVAVIGAEDRSSPDDSRSSAFNGATAGGLIGLGVGLYLVFQGITFNPAASTLSAQNAPGAGNTIGAGTGLAAAPPSAPFRLETDGSRITGFRADVLRLKF